jgi:hypothetical protein
MKFWSLIVGVFLTILMITGCGGGTTTGASGSFNGSSSSELNGTVATGTGQLADIVVIDTAGHTATTTTDDNGAYSISTTGMHQPIMIQATIRSTGNLMYSLGTFTNGTLNVTPLTTYIINQSTETAGVSGGVSQLFQTFTANSASTVSQISTVTTSLNNVISPAMSQFNVNGFNHFYDAFVANHTGYDAFLDSLDIETQQDDVVIRYGGTTLDTLNYDIQSQEINITGQIVNVTTNTPISGASVQAVDGTGHTISATTDSNGTFNTTVGTMRNYTITVTATGYQTQIIPHVSSFVFADQQIGTIPMFPNGLTGTTVLSGKVIDARTQDTGISNATLTFRTGYNTRIGTTAATITVDSSGIYTIAGLAIGSYTVEVSKSGFETRYINITLYGSTMTQDFSLISQVSSLVNGAFATIILNWNLNPNDIDSHLTGPSTTGRFHIYYAHKLYTSDGLLAYDMNADNPCASSNIVASLDRDDTTSYGPETTTLCRPTAGGVYNYYVHHYAGTSTMAQSPATVTLSLANGTTRTFTAPSAGSVGNDDIWHVFNFDTNGNVYPVNQIIGNGSQTSPLFAISSNILTSRFGAEKNLFINLPRK